MGLRGMETSRSDLSAAEPAGAVPLVSCTQLLWGWALLPAARPLWFDGRASRPVVETLLAGNLSAGGLDGELAELLPRQNCAEIMPPLPLAAWGLEDRRATASSWSSVTSSVGSSASESSSSSTRRIVLTAVLTQSHISLASMRSSPLLSMFSKVSGESLSAISTGSMANHRSNSSRLMPRSPSWYSTCAKRFSMSARHCASVSLRVRRWICLVLCCMSACSWALFWKSARTCPKSVSCLKAYVSIAERTLSRPWIEFWSLLFASLASSFSARSCSTPLFSSALELLNHSFSSCRQLSCAGSARR
mmetsp:Transcript_9321/g.21169  ORF Transcript_9321/g.21169 Transcript_9321/m.21169 type:complete len:305 (+) Transcript_9321:251-1165(+)